VTAPGSPGHRAGRDERLASRTLLIRHKERPTPKLNYGLPTPTGCRVTAFITDTGHGLVCGQLGGLELRHRQHAWMEDRIRQARTNGLRNLIPV
jgi:hypothetical protein